MSEESGPDPWIWKLGLLGLTALAIHAGQRLGLSPMVVAAVAVAIGVAVAIRVARRAGRGPVRPRVGDGRAGHPTAHGPMSEDDPREWRATVLLGQFALGAFVVAAVLGGRHVGLSPLATAMIAAALGAALFLSRAWRSG